MKAKKLSILTPVLANQGTVELLPETIASVVNQWLPNHWSYEWIIMEDGAHPKLQDYPWPDCVNYRSIDKQVGEPSARTLALSAASGDHVLAFDADDTLPETALSKICRAYDSYPKANWVAGQEATPRHKRPWRNRRDSTDEIKSGLCPPGRLYPFYQRSGQFPVTFQSSYKTEVLWRFGGYPAMPYAGDINLFFAVSSTDWGVVLHDVILNYRRWSGQMTAEPAYFQIEDLAAKHAQAWIGRLTQTEVEYV